MSGVIIILVGYLILSSKEYDNLKSGAKVTARSGIKIRTEPTINSDVIANAPFDAHLKIVDSIGTPDIVNGISGNWYRVNYNNNVGYAWGSYLEK